MHVLGQCLGLLDDAQRGECAHEETSELLRAQVLHDRGHRALLALTQKWFHNDGESAVRVQITRHARTHSVGKYQSCMF